MAWTITIGDTVKDGSVKVELREDVQAFTTEILVDPLTRDREIRNAIAKFNELFLLSKGDYTLPAIPPPPPQPPVDPDRSALDTFILSIRLLENFKRVVDLGVLPANDSDCVDLRTTVKDFLAARPLIKTKLIRNI